MKKILIITLFFFGTVVYAEQVGSMPVQTGSMPVQTGSMPVGESKPTIFPKITNPLKFNNITELVNGLVKLALELGTIVAVLALVWVGFKFIIAQGDPKKISEAKQMLYWVIIGIAILFSARIIVEIIKGTLSDFVDPSSWLKKP